MEGAPDFRLRFWAEFIEPTEIRDRGLELLPEYGAGVGLAVQRNGLTDEDGKALRELGDAGVEICLWPLLSREQGYFPTARNLEPFMKLIEELLEWCKDKGVNVSILAFDLEILYGQIREVLDAKPWRKPSSLLKAFRDNWDEARFDSATGTLGNMLVRLKEAGIRSLAAVFPWVALEILTGGTLVQRLMDTPVSLLDWDIISPMLYSSMLAGMSGGLLGEKEVNWLIYHTCQGLKEKRGDSAGVSLGLTGTGVLGDEPYFEEPEGLLPGLEAALAAGVTDVSIYNLEGVLRSKDPERWFEAIRGARPRVPVKSRKVDTILSCSRAMYPGVSVLAGRWFSSRNRRT